MLILSLDCAALGCSVCVWQDGQVLALASEAMARGQDSRLIPLIMEQMLYAKLDFAALDRIVATRGPGSFTGLRIALSAARSLGLASSKPVLGVDRFSVYARQFKADEAPLLIVLESKRKELFCCPRPPNGVLGAPQQLLPEEITAKASATPTLKIVGDVPDLCAPAAEAEVITAATLAAAASLDDPAFAPSPFYLRPPDVTIKKQ